jgi:glycosyltransferase involved in cell wall biosynthesis
MISAGDGFGPAAGGMLVYYRDLLVALCCNREVECIEAYVTPWVDSLMLPDDRKINAVVCRALPKNRFGRVIYEQSVLPALVSRTKPDVLLSTCNTRPLAWRGASVVVLQSIQHTVFPEAYGPLRRKYLERMVPLSLRTADAVIAVSEWERVEALRLFDIDPARIFAVPHGTSQLARNDASLSLQTQLPVGGEPYVLMVSTLYAFKNHRRLLEAFAKMVTRRTISHRLVIAGGDADVTASELAAYAQELGIGSRVCFLGPVPNDEVASLIAGAAAVAYPSLFETFGHPVLEALALGRCLVTSECTATREVAGDAARLVDPYDGESVAQGLEDVLLDPDLRRRLEAAGPVQAARFTWERCARDTLNVLRLAIDRARCRLGKGTVRRKTL